MRPRGRVVAARFRQGTEHPPIISLLAVFALSLLADLPKFAHPTTIVLGFFTDDFYYYLKVAQSLAHHRLSSFNGFLLTNGYHPLWLLTLAVCCKLTRSVRVILLFVTAMVALSSAVTFWLSRRIALRLADDADFALLIGLAAAFMQHELSCWGMETILAVPLALGLLEWVAGHPPAESPAAAFLFGLLGAQAVLARIDVAILVVLLGVFFLGELLSRLRFVFALLGAAPLWAYLAINRLVFGLWLPVSGMAKQLKPFGFHWPHLDAGHITLAFVVAVAVAILPALIMVLRRPLVGDGATRMAVAVLLFPLCYWITQGLLSDWPLWNWYAYPFLLAFPVASIVALPLLPGVLSRVALGLGIAGLLWRVGLLARTSHDFSQPTPMLAFAQQLAGFAQTHPGRYAMGDRAGLAGFLLPEAELQLEGLMGDQRFLARIRAREDLIEVMRDYGVVYYVARDPVADGACWLLSEPFKAGPASPRMASRLCAKPVFSVTEQADPEHVTQRVFRVDGTKP